MASHASATWWTSVRAFAALAGLWLLAAATPGASAPAQEYQVKAAYLPKFAPFVEWPPRAFATGNDPMVICILGADPFGHLLDDAVRGQGMGEHRFTVRRLATVSRDSGCHLLYLGQQSAPAVAEALKAVRGAPVLTITDDARQQGAHGVIHFLVKDNRVRFLIDDQAAAESGLVISSKLMGLALTVKRRS